jgi:hypothetical protein
MSVLEALTASRTYYVRAALPVPTFNSGSANVTMTAHGLSANSTVVFHIPLSPASCTMTIASPGVVTRVGHGFVANQPIVFNTSGALPTGVTPGTTYYVRATGLTADTFQFSTTSGGSAVNTSGSQSGTHHVQATGAMPTFSTAGLLTQGTVYYVGTVVDANTVTLSTTLSNANPLGTATLATGAPVYAAATGSDSNDGLEATPSGAFLTLAKAESAIRALDLGGFTATVQIGDGTYTAGVTITGPYRGGNVTWQGNAGTPANVIISTTSADAFILQNGARATVKDLRPQTTTSGFGFRVQRMSTLSFTNLSFGACATGHFLAADISAISASGAYSINGAASYHIYAAANSVVRIEGTTVTITGTPAFGAQFVYAEQGAVIQAASLTFSGSATGTRYSVVQNGVINTGGGGASYFPGSVAGITPTTGGQYL